MFQLLPVFLGLFDSTVQKLMNGFRDIFYELAYSNLSNMLSDLNEKVATISTELSTAPDAWQGGTIWELIVKIAEQVALPVAGTVFTFVVLWELISMLVQPNNLADIDFVSVLMKWLIKTIVAAWFISNALTICNCFFGIGASMVSKTTTVLNQQVTDNTQGSVLLKYLSDNYGDQDEDAESGDVSGLISLTVSTWFIDVIIKFMGILITIILYSRMISIYLHCAVAPLPMATVTNHHIGDNFYSKMVQFYDINYQLAQNDEKQHIFAEYCQFLNYFDETIHFQFCFINQRVDMEEYKKVISIPDQDDEFNVVRREYATYLRNQLEKADFILSFMELVVGGKTGLKPEEKSAIDFAVSRIYTKYFENPVPENMPILQDLYNELLSHKEDLVSQHIAQCMYLYVEGSNNLFNHHTNVDLDNRIICFDIKSLGKTLKKLGMLVVQDAVWNRVTVNREMHKFTRFYIDEFHLLLKDELTAAYSMEIWKRFRKWGGIPTGITQNVKDFLASKEIENIFDNSDFVYMLNQGADDRDILAQKLDISQHQIKYVTNVGQGEGLIFFGDIVQPFVDRFPKDTLMYTLLTTKPAETKTETEAASEQAG